LKINCSALRSGGASLVATGMLIGSASILASQSQGQSVQHPDSVVAILADGQGLPFVSANQLPPFGTFWEIRSSVPCITAPLPCPPLDPNTPVYALGGGQFLVDETDGQLVSEQAKHGNRALSTADLASIFQAQVDELQAFVAQIQSRQLNAQSTLDGQMSALTLDGPPVPGDGSGDGDDGDNGTNSPPMYMLAMGLCLYPPVFVSTNSVVLMITNTTDSGWLTNSYDLFYTTNMASLPAPALCATNWAWLGRSTPGQTNFIVSPLPQPECYFTLGTMQDSNGDGVSDAYTRLVGLNDTSDWDGDGVSNVEEMREGRNPMVQGAVGDTNGVARLDVFTVLR